MPWTIPGRTYWEYTRWVHREMIKQVAPGEKTALLFTGVDMHKHVMVEETDEELWVQVWVTAGVRTNAIRVGRDSAFGIERVWPLRSRPSVPSTS